MLKIAAGIRVVLGHAARAALVICVAVAVVQPRNHARAAEFQTFEVEGIPILLVLGEFKLEDGNAFAKKVEGWERAVIAFGSPGGNLLAGLRMGTIIHLKGFDTMVSDSQSCASACALAWLAGTNRFLGPKGRVGFHAASVLTQGQRREVGSGNALIGAYLNRLGLSDRAIVALTMAPPESILVLTPARARDLGIKVVHLPPEPQQKETRQTVSVPEQVTKAKPRRERTPKDLDSIARKFVDTYFGHWSETNGQAMRYFRRVYAEQVHFFDQTVEARVVLDEKKLFAEQWPERVYTAMPDTIKTRCDQETRTCDITAHVEWNCDSPARNMANIGRGEYTFRISVSPRGAVRIHEEKARIIGPKSS